MEESTTPETAEAAFSTIQTVDTTANPWANSAQGAPSMSLITVIGDTAVVPSTYLNEYSVMTVPAFWSAITFLTETLAMFSLSVNQDTDRGRGKAIHPLNSLLARRMNNISTPFRTLQTWFHHRWIWGNGYLWIKRDKRTNAPISLLNLNPEITVPFIYNGEVWYYVNFQKPVVIPAADVLHFAGIGFDGLRGYPLMQLMRQSLEVGKYAEAYSAKYFKKGSFVKGAIEVPGILTDKQFATMRDSVNRYKGFDSENSMEVMILQANAKLNNSTAPNQTSQLIETRRWSVIEVCQMLRVPPHILYELSHGKWNSVQQMGDEVIKYTFSAPMIQLEQELTSKLLSTDEQDSGFYIRIKADTLAKADINTQQTNVLQLVNGGIYTLNEGRELLELPNVGPDGDKFRVPTGGQYATGGNGAATLPGVSAADVDATDDTAAPNGLNAPDGPSNATVGYPAADDADETAADELPAGTVIDPDAIPASYSKIILPLLTDVATRVETKTDKAFEKRLGKPAAEITPWANVFAAEQERFVLDALKPLVTVATAFGKVIDSKSIATKYSDNLKRYASGQPKELLIDIMKEWAYE